VLEESGIDPERFDIQWVSSAEAARFADIVTRFTEKIAAIGPNIPGGVIAGQAATLSGDAAKSRHPANPE